jgi:hypothetical protein
MTSVGDGAGEGLYGVGIHEISLACDSEVPSSVVSDFVN